MFSAAKEDSIANLKKTSQSAKEDMYTTANQAGRKVRSILNTASSEVVRAGDKVTEEIRSNPVRSSVIALGAGLLLGVILNRR